MLRKYSGDKRFGNAAVKIKNILDNDDTVKLLSETNSMTKDEIRQIFKDAGSFK